MGRLESHSYSIGAGGGNISGSGSANQVAFFTGANTISSSADLGWDGSVLGVVGVIKLSNGSATDPAYAFINDDTTGTYLRAAGQIGFAAAGVEAGFVNGDWFLGADLNSVVSLKGRTLVGNASPVATGIFSIINSVKDGQTRMSGGDGSTDGGNIRLDGSTSGGTYKVSLNVSSTTVIGIASDTSMDLNTTTDTTATAGGAGALPATVEGYLSLTVNSTAVKIPYYLA